LLHPRLCVFALGYFVFPGRVTNPSAKPSILEDQFVSLSLASLLRPVRLGSPYQEHKVPAGIARKVIEARKPPPPPQRKGVYNRWSITSIPKHVKRPNPWRKLMKNCYIYLDLSIFKKYLSAFFSESKTFEKNTVGGSIHIFYTQNLFSQNLTVYKIMWNAVAHLDRLQMKI
jgi:hypothetical protein